ncbi:MAG TPA: SRPBCC family protein [Anaerolineae bacterium]|nr:SRPBCC family protein [Anaerolineae bacterium]
MTVYERSFKVKAALAEVAAFHDDPVSLIAITPPPVRVTIQRFDNPVHAGGRVIFRLSVGPFGVTWDGTIAEYVDQQYFRDVQNSGPFGAWSHTHSFVAETDGTRVIDRVEYRPPLGLIGKLIDPILVKPSLAFMFNYRARKTRELLEKSAKTEVAAHAYR